MHYWAPPQEMSSVDAAHSRKTVFLTAGDFGPAIALVSHCFMRL